MRLVYPAPGPSAGGPGGARAPGLPSPGCAGVRWARCWTISGSMPLATTYWKRSNDVRRACPFRCRTAANSGCSMAEQLCPWLCSTVVARHRRLAHPLPDWRAGERAREGFRLSDGTVPYPSEHLAQRVRRAAGTSPRAQWFRRDERGDGEGLAGGGQAARRLGATEFPELLLRQDWPNAEDAGLVRAFLDWQSPWLLSLQRLGRDSRRALE